MQKQKKSVLRSAFVIIVLLLFITQPLIVFQQTNNSDPNDEFNGRDYSESGKGIIEKKQISPDIIPISENANLVPISKLDFSETELSETNRIIVRFKDQKPDKSNITILSDKYKYSLIQSKGRIKYTDFEVFTVGIKDDYKKIVNDLIKDPNVDFVQPDYKLKTFGLPADAFFQYQWSLSNSNNIDINIIPAWEITKGNPNITVGVIDTGIDISHDDLKDNIYTNPNEIPGNNIDDDNNGLIDDVNGWDFANKDKTVYDNSTNDSHGTHVAGIIAARSNNIGISGVAPNVKVLPLKFIKDQPDGEVYGYTSDAIEAIEYAKKMSIKIVNCSWGSADDNQILKETMANSNILFVCAAGNDIWNNPNYPAYFNLPNILSVAALQNDGSLAGYSNNGSNISIAAPGSDIYSTLPGNNYGYSSGTSMAAPHATGVAALLLSIDSNLTPAQIKEQIQNSAVTSDLLVGKTINSGMIDAFTALGDPLHAGLSGVAGENTISVAWDPVEDVTGYEIESDGIVMDNGTATSRTFDGLTPNTLHFYRIRARYGDVYSQWSTGIIKRTLTNGNGTGVRGEYYSNTSLTGSPIIITNPTIDLDNPDEMVEGNGSDQMSVRWTGRIEPRYDEQYTFHTIVNGGVRLWINDTLLIDQWNNQQEEEFCGSISLNSRWRCFIKMEYRSINKPAKASLLWSSPSQVKEIVPSTRLFSTPYKGNGLGEWVTRSSMQSKRYSFGAVSAAGKVYVMGGMEGFEYEKHWDNNLDTLEEYDPATDTWTYKRKMPDAARSFAAASVNDKIYIMGGSRTSDSLYSSIVNEYDPATDTWLVKSSMPTGRYQLGAVVVNNKIYAIGGYASSGMTGVIEEYDPASDTWVQKTVMPTARYGTALAVYDGKIYIIGGRNSNGTSYKKVEVYDPVANVWEAFSDMYLERYGCSAAVQNDKIYVFGGSRRIDEAFYTTEEYDPVSDTWTTVENMPTPRTSLCAVNVGKRIFAIGGSIDNNLDSNEVGVSAVEEFAFKPVLESIKADRKSPQDMNAHIMLTVDAIGGNDKRYQFMVNDGSGWNLLQAYSTGNSFDWVPNAAGTYQIKAMVKDNDSANEYDDQALIDYTILSNDAELESLRISDATLNPQFDSGRTEYSVIVPNSMATINVVAEAKDSNSTIRINNGAENSGSTSSSINLDQANTRVIIEVTAPNGTTKKTYQIDISKTEDLAVVGSNPGNGESGIAVDSKIFIEFNKDIYEGDFFSNISLKKGTTVVDYVYSLQTKELVITPATDLIYNSDYSLVLPSWSVEDETGYGLQSDYYLNFTTYDNTNAFLKELSISNCTLNQVFNADTDTYSSNVPNSIDSVLITAKASDENARVKICQKAEVAHVSTESIPLKVGNNQIIIAVAAADNTTKKEYSININRAALPTIDSQAPTWTAPTLTLSNITKDSVFLSWTTATDNTGVTRYKIYINGYAYREVLGNTLSYTVTGLSPSTQYAFSVQAGDAANNWSVNGPVGTVTTSAEATNPQSGGSGGGGGGGSGGGGSGGSGGGGSGGSGGGGGGSASAPTVPTATQPAPQNGIIEVPIPILAGSGTATAGISPEVMATALDTAPVNAEGIKIMEIIVNKLEGANTYSLGIPSESLVSEASTPTKMIHVITDICTANLQGNMFTPEMIGSGKNVNILIGMADTSMFSDDLKQKIANKPILELGVQIDGIMKPWDNPKAPVTISIDYKPTEEELKNVDNIVVRYINGSNQLVEVPSGRYDPISGKVTFTVTHFSKYTILYIENKLDDSNKVDWAKKEIEAMVAKGIIKTASSNRFQPMENISRADFLYALVRTLGLSSKFESNFTDVVSSDYYYNEIGIAKQLGITNGSGNNRFEPNTPITRQDMMSLMARALKHAKRIKLNGNEADLDRFEDYEKISVYARDNIADVIASEIIKGDGKRLNPLSYTTRAEAAVIMYRIYNK